MIAGVVAAPPSPRFLFLSCRVGYDRTFSFCDRRGVVVQKNVERVSKGELRIENLDGDRLVGGRQGTGFKVWGIISLTKL